METNLGDKILKEYMKQTSKEEIIQKLEIDESMYNSWQQINKSVLDKIDEQLQKKKLRSTLKIRNIPEIDDDDEDEEEEEGVVQNKFLYKEPIPLDYQHHQQKKIMTLQHRKNQIQDKMNRLNDLESQKKIGHSEYLHAIKILNDEMENVNRLLTTQSNGE
jgi:hypothetical protein